MAEKKTDGPKAPAAPALARAAESTDPTVHHLLAQRQAHQMNKDAALANFPEAAKDADEKLAEVARQLAELGYE